MARKKIVFVIVEGPSDQDAIGLLLDKIFDKNKVHVHVTYGDLTSKAGNNPSNILRKVTEEIQGYAQNYHLEKIHFQQIIHIVDMDGAYISEDCVHENNLTEKPLYFEDRIETNNRQAIISRNQNKRNNLDKITETPRIWGDIPYSTYFMSCNLDHALYNKLNTSDEEKENNAYRFARRYRDDIEGFKSFISSSDFSVKGDYLETWKYIKESRHSLERHTNLGLCFQED